MIAIAILLKFLYNFDWHTKVTKSVYNYKLYA